MVFHILEEGRGSQDCFFASCVLRLRGWSQALTSATSLPDPSFSCSDCTTAQFRRSSKLPHSLGMKVFSWNVGSVCKYHKEQDPAKIQLSHSSNCCSLLRNLAASVCTKNQTAVVIQPTVLIDVTETNYSEYRKPLVSEIDHIYSCFSII